MREGEVNEDRSRLMRKKFPSGGGDAVPSASHCSDFVCTFTRTIIAATNQIF
jgi:hypothetical protein